MDNLNNQSLIMGPHEDQSLHKISHSNDNDSSVANMQSKKAFHDLLKVPMDRGISVDEANKAGADGSDGEGNSRDEGEDNNDDHDDDDSESTTSSTFEYSQDTFDTYKNNVIRLCRDIGFGEPSSIDRMEGDGFNRIIGLTFDSPKYPNCILRIPLWVPKGNQANNLDDHISVLQYVAKLDIFHVPSVIAYDFTTSNAIGNQYVLQERISGKRIQDVFYTLPLAEKLEITTLVAEMIAKLEATTTERPGRLVGTRSLPVVSNTAPTTHGRIGIAGYQKQGMDEDHVMVEKQPLTSFLVELLENQKTMWAGPSKLGQFFEELQTTARQMEKAGLTRTTDSETVLWHWGINPRNILVQRSDGTTDFQKAEIPKNHQHILKIRVDDHSTGHNHSVEVKIEDELCQTCKHSVYISVNDSAGKTYRHTLQINDFGANSGITAKEKDPSKSAESEQSTTKWEITGVLDWGDAMSVPRVVARKPPTWLWYNDESRTDRWMGDCDDPVERDLTSDELLIKAHFDQIMTKLSPSYVDDAYYRGVWLRKVAQFAIYGFTAVWVSGTQEKLRKDWNAYYRSLGMSDTAKGNNYEDAESLDDPRTTGAAIY